LKQSGHQSNERSSKAGQIYFDLWKTGVNLALRISDLLSITMADVKALDLDAPALHLVEQKTGKKRKLVVNAPALQIMQRRLSDNPKHKYLFQSEAVNLSRYCTQSTAGHALDAQDTWLCDV